MEIFNDISNYFRHNKGCIICYISRSFLEKRKNQTFKFEANAGCDGNSRCALYFKFAEI